MRKIVMFNRVTADGYVAGADGGLDWVVPDEAIDRAGVESMPASDTILFGRRTYEMFESFWPNALGDAATAPDPHAEGRRTEGLHAMAVWIQEATKIVFSRTRKEVTWKNSQLLHEFDPEAIAALKQQPGKDMMVFGSGAIASQLLEHGLVDEVHFVVGPMLLGSGRSLLGGVTRRTPLKLLEAKPYPSGNVVLRYACSG
ncbi:dihydrofolate reductase family protein [Chondromyces crocatus]|uniref:Deaminase n=1 Tax=Chondromyces crocatus TaxID=52 RepID=A0A0K1E4V5_CHOCO|nr:dihydrofolate reductase family protein [Chondromyces crocatus]AKT35916.1 deaminase [Chondromyces crocatus]